MHRRSHWRNEVTMAWSLWFCSGIGDDGHLIASQSSFAGGSLEMPRITGSSSTRRREGFSFSCSISELVLARDLRFLVSVMQYPSSTLSDVLRVDASGRLWLSMN